MYARYKLNVYVLDLLANLIKLGIWKVSKQKSEKSRFTIKFSFRVYFALEMALVFVYLCRCQKNFNTI